MTCDLVNKSAASLAGFAFMETKGADYLKVDAALWVYEWAKANSKSFGKRGSGMRAYPSLNEMRAALAERGLR